VICGFGWHIVLSTDCGVIGLWICGEWNTVFGTFRLLCWVRETDGLQCNRCTGRTVPGRWPAAPWWSRCLLRETGFTLRGSRSGTARPGSASTARQSEELRLRQVSTVCVSFTERERDWNSVFIYPNLNLWFHHAIIFVEECQIWCSSLYTLLETFRNFYQSRSLLGIIFFSASSTETFTIYVSPSGLDTRFHIPKK
jgi:hypothetical protein